MPYDKQADSCKNAIKSQQAANAKYFNIVTKAYRGDVKIHTVFKQGVDLEAKTKVTEKLSGEFAGNASRSEDGTVTVTGGFWIIETEPYAVQ